MIAWTKSFTRRDAVSPQVSTLKQILSGFDHFCHRSPRPRHALRDRPRQNPRRARLGAERGLRLRLPQNREMVFGQPRVDGSHFKRGLQVGPPREVVKINRECTTDQCQQYYGLGHTAFTFIAERIMNLHIFISNVMTWNANVVRVARRW